MFDPAMPVSIYHVGLHRFMDCWLLKSVVHDVFHIIPTASQLSFCCSFVDMPRSLNTLHCFCISITFLQAIGFLFFKLVLIFQDFRPGMSLALPGSDIYKHRLAERSPRNTHYSHPTLIRNPNDMEILWK